VRRPDAISLFGYTAFVQPTTLVWDLGNVLIGWEPRALYRKLFGDRTNEMERFLGEVCTSAWNLEQDRGRPFAQAVAELAARHPEHLHEAIFAYHTRWPEMLTGEIVDSVAILRALHAQGVASYALTNWNHETFAIARARYAWLSLFRGIVVSAEERCVKPEPAIYRILLDRYQLQAADCVFVDDSALNVEGARAVGMHALQFRDPTQLRAELRALGFGT
jgi:2-haloacid dehalogenase